MRDASGNLVEVRVREPWDLHLLTADGTNAAADDTETLKAPPEPGLMLLTPICVELLVERYVRWHVRKDKTSYFAALPRQFVDALREYSPSDIPVVRAINTTPLVTMSGNVIDGVGLDRNTGLVHRIDPLLRSCLPADAPSERDVRDAVNFLFDEWLADVALDKIGKSVAVMMALTLIERTLLSERPAFFITAGQRGGGKTTLVMMIVLAVLGRKAAAASWSESLRNGRRRCSPICARASPVLFGTTSLADLRSAARTLRLRSRHPSYPIGFWEFLAWRRRHRPPCMFSSAIRSRRAVIWRAGHSFWH